MPQLFSCFHYCLSTRILFRSVVKISNFQSPIIKEKIIRTNELLQGPRMEMGRIIPFIIIASVLLQKLNLLLRKYEIYAFDWPTSYVAL